MTGGKADGKTADSQHLDQLFQAVAAIGDAAECKAFLLDLCTMREIEDMAQRLQVAELLDQGVTYEKIMQQVDVSTATISRVNRSLQYGTGGYEAILRKLQKLREPASE